MQLAIGLAFLDVLRLLAERSPSSLRSTICNGSTPPRHWSFRLRFGGCATSRLASLRHCERLPTSRPRSTWSAPSRAAACAAAGWCAEPRRRSTISSRTARARVDAAGARSGTRGIGAAIRSSRSSSGASSFVRTRGPQPARRCACLRACGSCSVGVWRGCQARRPTFSCRSPRSPDRPSTWSRRRMVIATACSRRSMRRREKGSSSSTSRGCVSYTRCLLRSATSRRRSGSAAPFTARSPAPSPTPRNGHATVRSPPRARRGVASELDAAAEHAATRGATAAAAELSELAAELTPMIPSGRGGGGCGRPTSTASRATASELSRCSSNSSPRCRPVSSGPTFSWCSSRCSTDRQSDDRALRRGARRGAGDDARVARILAFRSGVHLFNGDVGAALADGRAALEAAERVGDPALLAVAIGRVGRAEM